MRSFEPLRLTSLSGGMPFYALAWTGIGQQQWRRRDFVEALAVVEGEGRIEVIAPDGRRTATPIGPGDLFLLRPRDSYRLVSADDTGVSGYTVALAMPHWSAFSSLVGISPRWLNASDPVRLSFDVLDSRVIDSYERAVRRFRSDPSMLHIVEFWVVMAPVLFAPSEVDRREAPQWLASSLEAMLDERNLAGGVPRLVELARVTPSYLSRAMRRFVGMTPSEVVLDLRLQHAAELLTTTTEGIGPIAARCGFVTASYFSLAFKKSSGMSPREYRRHHVARLSTDLGSVPHRRWSPVVAASERQAPDPAIEPTALVAPVRDPSTRGAIRVTYRWD
jgi:AraC-like DNA-binding protein